MNFSILLSLYYKELPKNLDQCLASIWDDQGIKPNEIVLVEDGKLTDELYCIISDWKDKLGSILKVISLDENLGLGLALNEGLKYCTNEWVFRMDTDDICTNDRFEKQVSFIKNNPNIILFGGQIKEFQSYVNDSEVVRKVPLTQREIYKAANYKCPFNHMTLAYKKSVILTLGGYKADHRMEDYDLWLRVLATKNMVANLPDILVHARVGNGMHARRRGKEYIYSECKIAKLKSNLGLQSYITSYSILCLRASIRLFPTSVISLIYKYMLRK